MGSPVAAAPPYPHRDMKNKKPYNPYLISRVHRPWYTDGLYWTLIGLFAFVFLMGVIVGELLG